MTIAVNDLLESLNKECLDGLCLSGMRTRIRFVAQGLVLTSGVALVGASGILGATTVLAQDAGAEQRSFDEIVVKARQRNEDLFDVPVAVSAMGSEYLERYSLNSIEAVTEMTPGLDLARPAGGSGAGIRVRGLGTDGTDAGFEQSVLVDIDGLQVGRGRALWQSYFDLEQIEVMKGPQSLFFGKNSPAGVISISSKGATEQLEGYIRAGYEFKADEAYLEGAISGPLTEAIGGRLAVRSRDMKGWMENTAIPLTNPISGAPDLPGATDKWLGERETAVRLTLEYDDGGPFTANFKLMGVDYDDDGAVMRLEQVYCEGGVSNLHRVTGGVTPDPGNECKANWKIHSSEVPEDVAKGYLTGSDGGFFTDQESVVSSLTLNYQFGDYTLTSVTGYYYIDSAYLMNNDWSSFASITANENERYKSASQQFRLLSDYDAPVNFMLGAYLEDSQLDFTRSTKLDDLPPDPVTGLYQWVNHRARVDGKAYSAFGQLMWDITDAVEATVGSRWTREKKTGYVGNTYVHSFLTDAFPKALIDAGFKDENVSSEATISWHPTEDVMLYAAYKEGYKSGGISASAFVSNATLQDDLEFEEETAKGFEVGLRMELLDRSLRISATGYQYEFKNLQVNAWDPDSSSYSVRNAAEAEQEGIEVDVSWLASDYLQLNAALNYNRSRFDSFPVATCYSGQTVEQGCIGGGFQDLSGRPTVNAPDWVANVGFVYTQPLMDRLNLQVTGDAQYKDDYYYVITQSPNAIQKDFVRVNGSIRLSPIDERWSLALIGRNLTNKKVITSGMDRPGGLGDLNGVLARPREVRLELSWNFH